MAFVHILEQLWAVQQGAQRSSSALGEGRMYDYL